VKEWAVVVVHGGGGAWWWWDVASRFTFMQAREKR